VIAIFEASNDRLVPILSILNVGLQLRFPFNDYGLRLIVKGMWETYVVKTFFSKRVQSLHVRLHVLHRGARSPQDDIAREQIVLISHG